jgi:predicted ATPase
MFFVERIDGTSKVRPVQINEFGGIPEWPAGFLDQAAREVEAIMKAIQRKRDDNVRSAD